MMLQVAGYDYDGTVGNNIEMDEFFRNKETANMINSKVFNIIGEMQEAVKKDHTIMNNVEKMFILD